MISLLVFSCYLNNDSAIVCTLFKITKWSEHSYPQVVNSIPGQVQRLESGEVAEGVGQRTNLLMIRAGQGEGSHIL